MSLAVWIGAAFVLGLLVGGGAMLLARRGGDAEARLRRLRREFDSYQREVADHYAHTAELLTRLRGGFSQLYEHVETGAESLVSEEALQRRLRQLEKDTGAGTRAAAGDGRAPARAPTPALERVGPVADPGPQGGAEGRTEGRAEGGADEARTA